MSTYLSTPEMSARERGGLLVVTLVFLFVFFLLFTSLLSFVLSERELQIQRVESERAFTIAEAGLDFYKWYLAHYPDDTTFGTTTPGPYTVPYEDPELGEIGAFELDITGNLQCGELGRVDITSTGYTNVRPQTQRTVFGRYSRPTVADYAYIIDSAVWAGPSREIFGPYHSNGGIRMDGTNSSTVSSALGTWECTSSYGCNPTIDPAPGVVGDGPNDHLWATGTPNISFNEVTADLAAIRELTFVDGFGLYFPQVSGGSPQEGYHVIFNGDNTVSVFEVEDSDRYWSYASADGSFSRKYEWITASSEVAGSPFTIPPDCAVLYFEDRVWVEGEVDGRVSLVAADLQTGSSYDPDIILNGDLTYVDNDGSDGITLIAEHNITIPLRVPDGTDSSVEDMELQGIFIAQNGRFGRNHYRTSGYYDIPNALNDFQIRGELAITGTIVSKGRVGTQWVSGGTPISGFVTRVNRYDAFLAEDPPPLTPTVSDDYRFILWREE
ncbi:hypothetical protein GVX82_01620 [Patescibacteria group bacterium]|jgi:hypothetical protein|nr:hypothetical protein [Patescibacteria group bacterium]